MLTQILIGSLLITATTIVQATFMGIAISGLTFFGSKLSGGAENLKHIATLSAMTLWLIAGMSVGIWMWAGAFLITDIFQSLEESLYFSVVAFTTLGFGDVILPQQWRLLSGFIAANGLILFGLNTAFLIELMSRLRDVDKK
ncbi:MAG: ion channel [Gammaproteobacteria bacterium]